MDHRKMENLCFGEASNRKQAKDNNMGQIYAYQKAQQAAKELTNSNNSTTDIHQLVEAQNLQKKIESESYKIMQTHEQYKMEITVKKQAYSDAVKTLEKQNSEILQMTKTNEHLTSELESELKHREMLVMKVNNSHEIYRTLAANFDHTNKNLKEFYAIKEIHEKRFTNLGEECARLKADFTVLNDKFETERAHLRTLVTEEHEKRILDIQQSNKQIQLAEQRSAEKMNLLREEQHRTLNLLKVLENKELEIKDLHESSEHLIQKQQQMTTQLNSELEHTRMEISQLNADIERYQGIEAKYNKLLPAFNTVEKEKAEALQRLISTESTLKSVETEKDDSIKKLESATMAIAKTQNEKTEIVQQLQTAQSEIEMAQIKKDEILNQLGAAEHSIKSLESEHAVTMKHFQVAKTTIQDKENEKLQMAHQLEIAESLMNTMKLEITDIAEKLKLAECALEVAESEKLMMQRETSEVIHQLQLSSCKVKCVEEEKAQISQQLQLQLSTCEELKIEKSETFNELLQSKLDLKGAQMSVTELEQKLFNTDNEKNEVQLKLSAIEKELQTLNIELTDAKTIISGKKSENENLTLQLEAANKSTKTLIADKEELSANLESAELAVKVANDEKMELLLMTETIEEKKCLLQEEIENVKLINAAQSRELSETHKELESRDKAIADYQSMEIEHKAQIATNEELIAKLQADQLMALEQIEKAALKKLEERKYVQRLGEKSMETIEKYKEAIKKRDLKIAMLKAQVHMTPTNGVKTSQDLHDNPPAMVRKSRVPHLSVTPRSCLKSGTTKSPSPKRVKFEDDANSSGSELVVSKRKPTQKVQDVKEVDPVPEVSGVDPQGISPKTNPFMVKKTGEHRFQFEKQRKEKK